MQSKIFIHLGLVWILESSRGCEGKRMELKKYKKKKMSRKMKFRSQLKFSHIILQIYLSSFIFNIKNGGYFIFLLIFHVNHTRF